MPTAALPGIGASIRTPAAARFSRDVVREVGDPADLDPPPAGCSSYRVTDGPRLMSIRRVWTPKARQRVDQQIRVAAQLPPRSPRWSPGLPHSKRGERRMGISVLPRRAGRKGELSPAAPPAAVPAAAAPPAAVGCCAAAASVWAGSACGAAARRISFSTSERSGRRLGLLLRLGRLRRRLLYAGPCKAEQPLPDRAAPLSPAFGASKGALRSMPAGGGAEP